MVKLYLTIKIDKKHFISKLVENGETEMYHIRHTVFAQVTSHGSGGRANIIHGHPITVYQKSDSALTSKRFLQFVVGTKVVVELRIGRNKRYIKNVYSTPMDEQQFINYNKNTLEKENNATKTIATRWGIPSYVLDYLETYDPTELQSGTVPNVTISTPGIKVSSTVIPSPKMSKDDLLSSIYIGKNDMKLFDAIHNLSKTRHAKVLMIGGSGYGKTSVPRALASKWSLDFIRWDCANVRDPEEFFGYREAIDGETTFVPTKLTEMIENGNCVIVFDEINRIEPYIANSLFPLLDHDGKTTIHGREIKVGENVVFFATINMGFQFTGTFVLDTALVNRFDVKVQVDSLPEKVEEDLLVDRTGIDKRVATSIVQIMNELRKLNKNGDLLLDASTRVSLQIADLFANGLDLDLVFRYTLLNGLEPEEQKNVVDIIKTII